MLELFINQQIQVERLFHSLIVRFEICGCDFPISINNILENIAARDYKESGVLIIQLVTGASYHAPVQRNGMYL